MEKYFLTGFLIYLIILLSSCNNSSAYLDVIEGNYAFSRGEYQDANLNYLRVRDIKIYKDYISYNLGNVYYALGEIDSAFKEWESVDEKLVNELTIRSLFNTGVLLFELSRYEEASKIFRNILELDSSYVKAKINLEHCIQKINFTSENKIDYQGSFLEPLKKTDDVSRVLDFVKRRETYIWKSSNESNQNNSTLKDW